MASRISSLQHLCLTCSSWKVSGANFKWATGGEGEMPRAVSPESPSLGPFGAPSTRVSLQKSILMGFDSSATFSGQGLREHPAFLQ